MLQFRAMYERSDLEPIRGMRDHMPDELTRLITVRNLLEHVLDDWGYRPIDLPILERRELYLKKSGEELVGKLYDFAHSGRSLALRPEWTASVLRAYLKGLQSEPLPVRLRYAGPVFRYERPQRVTYRQFTQVGIELIGGPARRADAEVIMLACRGLAAIQVPGWTLTLGHVGIARTLLAGLALPERTASQLLWSMERLRRNEHESLRFLGTESEPDTFELGPLAELPDEQLGELLAATIRAMGLSLESTTRPPEAIIERLIRKLRRADPQPRIQQALESLRRLGEARGAPDVALGQARQLFEELRLPMEQLDELQAIIRLLGEQGLESPRLMIDLGLSRGLHYYSGMIFEIESDGLQLCGGGRYDELIGVLQGSSGPRRNGVPAVGFAYGLERVASVSTVPTAQTKPSVMVAAGDSAYSQAMQTADALRTNGYRVLLDVRGRSLQANLRDAERRGCQALLVVEDGSDGTLAWHVVGATDTAPVSRSGSLADLLASARERMSAS